MKYHCEAFNDDGRRIGGFVVNGEDMSEALLMASKNIEVKLRPDQYRLSVTQLVGLRPMPNAEGAIDFTSEFADEPCAYGDNCPIFGNTNHGRCLPCKARTALGRTS